MKTWHVAVLCLIIALGSLIGSLVLYTISGMTTTVGVFAVTGFFFAIVGIIVAILSFAQMLERLASSVLRQ